MTYIYQRMVSFGILSGLWTAVFVLTFQLGFAVLACYLTSSMAVGVIWLLELKDISVLPQKMAFPSLLFFGAASLLATISEIDRSTRSDVSGFFMILSALLFVGCAGFLILKIAYPQDKVE